MRCRAIRSKSTLPGAARRTPTLPQSTSKHEESLTEAEKVAFVGVCRNYHFQMELNAPGRSGRSGSNANVSDANPGAPGRDIVPHSTDCRQVALAGDQRDRAALCTPRGRSLGGLAAFPALLSGTKGSRDETGYDNLHCVEAALNYPSPMTTTVTSRSQGCRRVKAPNCARSSFTRRDTVHLRFSQINMAHAGAGRVYETMARVGFTTSPPSP